MELQSYNNKKSGKEKRIMKTRVLFIRELLSFWIIYHCCSIYECPGPTIPFSKKSIYSKKMIQCIFVCSSPSCYPPFVGVNYLNRKSGWKRVGPVIHFSYLVPTEEKHHLC